MKSLLSIFLLWSIHFELFMKISLYQYKNILFLWQKFYDFSFHFYILDLLWDHFSAYWGKDWYLLICRYFQFFWHHLLKNLSFPHWITLSKLSCLKSNDHICMVFFQTVNFILLIYMYIFSTNTTVFIIVDVLEILQSVYSNFVLLSSRLAI